MFKWLELLVFPSSIHWYDHICLLIWSWYALSVPPLFNFIFLHIFFPYSYKLCTHLYIVPLFLCSIFPKFAFGSLFFSLAYRLLLYLIPYLFLCYVTSYNFVVFYQLQVLMTFSHFVQVEKLIDWHQEFEIKVLEYASIFPEETLTMTSMSDSRSQVQLNFSEKRWLDSLNSLSIICRISH